MKLTIVSDLHLEFGEVPHIQTDADVLILAGDICLSEDLHQHDPTSPILTLESRAHKAEMYRDFLAKCSDNYKHVLYVAGNHEFYHGKFNRGLETLKLETQRFHNMHFLEDDGIRIDDVLFLGSTLWTNFNNLDPVTMQSCQYSMNDYHVITNDTAKGFSKLHPSNTLQRHNNSMQFLQQSVKDQTKVVVVTHHAPSFISCSDRYKDEPLMNGAYASDLSEFILDNPQIKLWCHGHMHNFNDYLIGDTRIYSNPCGYPHENNSWQTTTIEV